MEQGLDLCEVKALYFYSLSTDLSDRILLEIETDQRPHFPVQLQGSVEMPEPGHITGIGEQHRIFPVHSVVFHHPAGTAGGQVLRENIIQDRPLFGIAEQL